MKRIAAILTSLVLVFSLAACGSQQAGTAAGSEAASTASSETASAAQTKTEEQLLAEENDILTANDELWEKVFASMDKNVTQTTLNNNYGDFLMDAVDNAKDQFTEEEYASLKADWMDCAGCVHSGQEQTGKSISVPFCSAAGNRSNNFWRSGGRDIVWTVPMPTSPTAETGCERGCFRN